MERTQIYLTREHRVRLDAVARARQISTAQVIREAVERYLAAEASAPAPDDALLDLIGAAGDLDPTRDVARSHDRYLAMQPRSRRSRRRRTGR